jgi:hypothetical protein
MNYALTAVRFILTGIVALLLVLLLAGCTVGPKYVRPAVPTSTRFIQGVRPVAARASQGSGEPRKLVGNFWRSGTQPAGRADRRFQPEPESSGSALPRSSSSHSLQSGFAVSDHFHFTERQLC